MTIRAKMMSKKLTIERDSGGGGYDAGRDLMPSTTALTPPPSGSDAKESTEMTRV